MNTLTRRKEERRVDTFTPNGEGTSGVSVVCGGPEWYVWRRVPVNKNLSRGATSESTRGDFLFEFVRNTYITSTGNFGPLNRYTDSYVRNRRFRLLARTWTVSRYYTRTGGKGVKIYLTIWFTRVFQGRSRLHYKALSPRRIKLSVETAVFKEPRRTRRGTRHNREIRKRVENKEITKEVL